MICIVHLWINQLDLTFTAQDPSEINTPNPLVPQDFLQALALLAFPQALALQAYLQAFPQAFLQAFHQAFLQAYLQAFPQALALLGIATGIPMFLEFLLKHKGDHCFLFFFAQT